MIRVILTKCVEGVIKRFYGKGRPGEIIENREYIQHYGFTSMPKAGSEGIVLQKGNMLTMIASDDRRYRIKELKDGEVALYTDEGDYAHFKRGRVIEIKTTTLKIIGDVKVTGKITSTDDMVSDKTVKGKGDVVFPNSLVPGAFISGKSHTHPVSGAATTAPSLPAAV